MKRFSILLPIFIFFNLAFCQSSYFNVTETKEIEQFKRTNAIEAVYVTPEENIAVTYQGKKKLLFDIYDANGQQILTKEIALDKKESIIGHVKGNMELKVFTLFKPSKTERHLKCHTLNLNNNSVMTVPLFKTTVEKNNRCFQAKTKGKLILPFLQMESFWPLQQTI